MGQIVGTGIDVIEIDRVRRAIERADIGRRFLARVFTEREEEYCESRGILRYQSYAARFAAKEATMKALGTGWSRRAGWREIEVVRERGGPPAIVLTGSAAEFARAHNVARLHLSLSHTAREAIASVIAESSARAR